MNNLYKCHVLLDKYDNKIIIRGNNNTLDISKLENDLDVRNLDIESLRVTEGNNKKLITSNKSYDYLYLQEVDIQNDLYANYIKLRNSASNVNISSSEIMDLETAEQKDKINYFKNISANKITLYNKNNSKTLNIIDYLSAEVLKN